MSNKLFLTGMKRVIDTTLDGLVVDIWTAQGYPGKPTTHRSIDQTLVTRWRFPWTLFDFYLFKILIGKFNWENVAQHGEESIKKRGVLFLYAWGKRFKRVRIVINCCTSSSMNSSPRIHFISKNVKGFMKISKNPNTMWIG